MKKLQIIGALAILGLLQACAVNHYTFTDKDGNKAELYQTVLFQKTAAKGMRVSPKTGFTLNGLENETQEEAIAKVVEAAVKGAVKGAVPVP